jgi:hypothetical protein
MGESVNSPISTGDFRPMHSSNASHSTEGKTSGNDSLFCVSQAAKGHKIDNGQARSL